MAPSARKAYKAILWYIRTFPTAYPSQARIARQTGLSVRTVRRAIKALKAAGILEVSRSNVARGRHRTNRYARTVPWIIFTTPSPKPKKFVNPPFSSKNVLSMYSKEKPKTNTPQTPCKSGKGIQISLPRGWKRATWGGVERVVPQSWEPRGWGCLRKWGFVGRRHKSDCRARGGSPRAVRRRMFAELSAAVSKITPTRPHLPPCSPKPLLVGQKYAAEKQAALEKAAALTSFLNKRPW